MTESDSAIIIGGGITGLTLGWAMQRAGREVLVLEKANHAGGAVRTIKCDGYLAEAGPNSLLVNRPELDALLRAIGLGDQTQQPESSARKRYILRDGTFLAAPMGPGDLLSTKLFSLGGKLRVLGDLWANASPDGTEESLADFVVRHFGRAILDYAVNPFVGGIYAGDPKRLSAWHAFPALAEAERTAGSVIRGTITMRRTKRARGEAFKPYSLSFRNGMQALPGALAAGLGEQLKLGASISSIEINDDGWRVLWRDSSGSQYSDCAASLYLTIPAFALDGLPLPDKVKNALAPLAAIEYPPVASVALGYPRQTIAHPLDGFGGLIPEKENRQALGVLFSSSLFAGRAPAGKALLTVFVGGSRQPELARQSTDAIRATAEREVADLLGVSGEPELAEVTVWPRAIPQYTVGYGEYLEAMSAAETQFPGLRLLGNYRGGISVGQCLLNAAQAAGMRWDHDCSTR